MNKKLKILAITLIVLGFLVNFVAIGMLIVPFVTKKANATLTGLALGIYFLAFVLLFAGFIILFKHRNDKE